MANAFHGTPPTLQEALRSPVAERRRWQDDLAPTYIGLFMLVVFYDQLAQRTLSIGGLTWSLLGAGVGGLLCFVLLYLAPALWGFRSRQPLTVVATSTFGARGAPFIPGLVDAVAQVVWFAVSISIAADVALRGLAATGLVPASALAPAHWGSLAVRSPLFLFVTLVWSFSSALIGIWLVRLIAAVMKVYAIFPAIALGAAMIWAMPGLRYFHVINYDPVTGDQVANGGLLAFLMMVQLVFGFFATSGASAVDWGAYCREDRDVRLGGLIGVAFSAWILAALALLTVAGALGRTDPAFAQRTEAADAEPDAAGPSVFAPGPPRGTAPGVVREEPRVLGPEDFTLSVLIQQGIGGVAACVILLAFGLALLGPTCFTPFVYAQRFAAVGPRLRRWVWSAIGAAVAWPLIAIGVPLRTDLVFGLLGAAMAPVVGALAADYIRNRGAWPGPRRGVNLAGVAAWAVGFAVGLIPYLGDALGSASLRNLQPAAVLAFVAAFLAYTLLAMLKLEPPPLEADPVPVESAPLVTTPAEAAPSAAEPAASEASSAESAPPSAEPAAVPPPEPADPEPA